MSIFDETGRQESLTEGWRALELFTNRHEATRLFASRLNDDPPHGRILFFYGDGGNGKSLLLRFFREHYLKRLSADNWEYVRGKTDEELAWHMKNTGGAKPVPFALLDFGMKPVGEDRPQEAFSGLLMLRRALAHSAREANRRLRFPLYDFACVWYLHSTRALTKGRLQNLFPSEEMDFISEVVDAVSASSAGALGKAVLNILGKYSRTWFTMYSRRRRLDEEQIRSIQRMDPESELTARLPRLFAEDLNVSMSLAEAPERVLLLFDAHEALWGSQRDFSPELFFQRDEWLHHLLGSVELTLGIVAVVAGRERPRWAEATKYRIPEEFVEPSLVGHLSDADAISYLERAGVEGAALRQSVVDYARVEPNQVHPLYLGLCADVTLAAHQKGETLPPESFLNPPQTADKAAELMGNLLRYVDIEVDYAVRSLCACRAFDKNLYLKLGQAPELNFNVSSPIFHAVLTRFSFVWRAEQRGAGWYRIHELLRRLTLEQGDEQTLAAHGVLESHYRECFESGDLTAIAEVVYHSNRQDWARGVAEWGNVFLDALKRHRYEICRALLDVRPDLLVKTEQARGAVSYAAGRYFAALALYDEAIQEYSEAVARHEAAARSESADTISYNDLGVTQQKLGELQFELSQYEKAKDSYRKSIDNYDEALKRSPDYVHAYNNKGSALCRLGEVQVIFAELDEAAGSYMNSISECNHALLLAPDYVDAYVNNGTAAQKLGHLNNRLSRHEAAAECYRYAVEIFGRGLQHDPENIDLLTGKGNVLRSIGELQVRDHQFVEADKKFGESVATFDRALLIAPDTAMLYSNKGYALQRLGESQAIQSRAAESIISHRESIRACDEAIRRAPNFVLAHNNKGNALMSLAALQFVLTHYDEAVRSYTEAVAAFDEALEYSPVYIYALNNKGIALYRLGDLHAMLLERSDAHKNYCEALTTFTRSLEVSPGDNKVRETINGLQKLIKMWS